MFVFSRVDIFIILSHRLRLLKLNPKNIQPQVGDVKRLYFLKIERSLLCSFFFSARVRENDENFTCEKFRPADFSRFPRTKKNQTNKQKRGVSRSRIGGIGGGNLVCE